MKNYKLTFECVPEPCWRDSLAQRLPRELWDKIRKDAYARAGYKCSICGAKGRLEAHEKWSYDEQNAVQKLETVIALCNACHSVKHISRTYLVGRGAEAETHFRQVNNCSQMEYHAELAKMNEEYLRRNRIENWTTDFSWLINYGKEKESKEK